MPTSSRATRYIGVGIMVFALLALTDFYVCPVKLLLHIPCPGCGLTRGFIAILHLRFIDAFNDNALSIPIFLVLGSITFFTLVDLLFKTRILDSLHDYDLTNFQIMNLVLIFALNWSMNIIRGI
jgi:hypothetical protein